MLRSSRSPSAVTESYFALLDALNPLGLAYRHIAEGPATELTPLLRQRWTGTVILNPFTPGAYTGPEALKLVESGVADPVSYAALFLANPDLPERLAASGPFNTPDYSKAYGEITWATPTTQPCHPTQRRQL